MTLRIRNWDTWQSYRKDRGQPPWIKVYRRLTHDANWVSLSDAQRGQLVAIWILAADRNGVIPASPRLLRKLCHMDEEPNTKLLIELGFIERCQDDANMAPERRQHDHPETETETDTDKKEDMSETSVSDPCENSSERKSKKRISYPPEFQSFWTSFPTDPLMSKKEALVAWQRLSPDDRTQAAKAVPGFRRYCDQHPTYRPVHACRFLSQRRFEGFAPGTTNGPPANLTPEQRRDWIRKQMEEDDENARAVG